MKKTLIDKKKVEYTIADYGTFSGRLKVGQKFEEMIVKLLDSHGIGARVIEFESAEKNATEGDISAIRPDGREIFLEIKYTTNIAEKSIDRFNGSFYIITNDIKNNVKNTKVENIWVIPKHTIKKYLKQCRDNNNLIRMPSGDNGIHIILEKSSPIQFYKKMNIIDFINNNLVFKM